MKKMHFGTLATMAGALALLGPTQSLADPIISGSLLNISGAGVVSAVSLDWSCAQPGNPACVAPPANTGDFSVAASTGSFLQYNGTFGTIRDINNFSQPLNTIFSLPEFMTFNLNDNLSIELTFIPLGTNTASATCVGIDHCTPQNPLLVTPNNPLGLSAFNLDRTATGTTATFGIRGIVHSNDGFSASLLGTYTTQFVGLTPDEALAVALAGEELTYSSQLVATVAPIPEPSQMLLTGFGLLGAALIRRRRQPKN